jgi:hypothetical protein
MKTLSIITSIALISAIALTSTVSLRGAAGCQSCRISGTVEQTLPYCPDCYGYNEDGQPPSCNDDWTWHCFYDNVNLTTITATTSFGTCSEILGCVDMEVAWTDEYDYNSCYDGNACPDDIII